MNIGIWGLGLMGGSFGRTLVKNTGHRVFGYDVSESALLKGELLNAYHERLTKTNLNDIDLLIVAVTPDKFAAAAEEALPYMKKGAYINDFCGTKRGVIASMKNYAKKYPDVVFVGGHPMAGREFSGIEHSVTTLFDKASMILVNVNADIFALEKLKDFYLSVGFGNVEVTTAENHDETIAFTSQLCHVVSNAFIKNDAASRHYGYSAGSYRDMTRVAKLNPSMWAELMTENADNVSKELEQLIGNLIEYKNALDKRDKNALEKLLAEGNSRKLEIDRRSAKKE
ncbi:MAG: prephenate dehydrogenase [Christensenellales bacterium]